MPLPRCVCLSVKERMVGLVRVSKEFRVNWFTHFKIENQFTVINEGFFVRENDLYLTIILCHSKHHKIQRSEEHTSELQSLV